MKILSGKNYFIFGLLHLFLRANSIGLWLGKMVHGSGCGVLGGMVECFVMAHLEMSVRNIPIRRVLNPYTTFSIELWWLVCFTAIGIIHKW